MKQTVYASIAMMSVVWCCGSINACDRIGLAQALAQIACGTAVFVWAFIKGKLWIYEEEKK